MVAVILRLAGFRYVFSLQYSFASAQRGSLMSIQGMESVLQQLQATAMLARSSTQPQPQASVDFAGELHAALDRISETQQAARTQAQNFSMDVPGVSLNDVMVDLQKSSISLQMGIQVRNKLVAAYQDIMSMQV